MSIRSRGEKFRELARYHRAASLDLGGDFLPGSWCGNAWSEDRWYQEELQKIRNRYFREAKVYHKLLAAKYFRASRSPWLPVVADPTPPPLAFPKTVVDWGEDVVLARP